MTQDRGLDPEVVGHDPLGTSPGRTGVRDVVGRGARHHADEIDTARSLFSSGRFEKGRFLGGTERSGHCAEIADVACESPGVDTGDTGHARALKEGFEIALRAPVAASPGEIADDDAASERPMCLVVEGRDPVVADVGIGEGDQLTGIGGIGDDLLIPGERRVEHDLARGDTTVGPSADGLAFEHGAVGQDEERLFETAHRWASPSRTVGTPHSNVWRTLPRTTLPA